LFFQHGLRRAPRSKAHAHEEGGEHDRATPYQSSHLLTHRITNAASEGINASVQLLSSRARGFRKFADFRVAILFRHGGLQLHPRRES
jgi:hypothetical protein